MNLQERDELLAELEQMKAIDFMAEVREQNPDKDISAMRIGEQSLDVIGAMWERVITQLEERLLADDYFVLPMSVNGHPYLGNFNLLNNVRNLRNNLQQNNQPNLFSGLSKSIQYQVEWGFWDRSEARIHRPEDINLKTLQSELNLLKEHLRNEINHLNASTEKVQEVMTSLEKYSKGKKAELDELTTALESVRNKKGEVETLFKSVDSINSNAKAQIEALSEFISTSKSAVTKDLDEIGRAKEALKQNVQAELEAIKGQKTELEEYIESLSNQSKDFDKKLKFVNSQDSYIKDKRDEITRLTGFAADTVLSHSFDKRAKEIVKSVNLWRGISGVVTALTVGWIFLLITNFCTDFAIDTTWDSFFLNFFKTSPFFVALGFALAQYTKERSLLEEYAFKTAVALTINPYADKLDTAKENMEKQQLIIASVMNVYSKPKGMEIKDKQALDYLKSLFSQKKEEE